MKHANPAGAAVADDLATAYRLALSSDETSAFGGVVAIAGPVDAELAEVVAAGPQADVIVAEHFDAAALERLRARRTRDAAAQRRAARADTATVPVARSRRPRPGHRRAGCDPGGVGQP